MKIFKDNLSITITLNVHDANIFWDMLENSYKSLSDQEERNMAIEICDWFFKNLSLASGKENF